MRARANALQTLQISKEISSFEHLLSPKDQEALGALYPNGRAFIWGVKLERASQWGKMLLGDTLVLFRKKDRVFLRGIISYKVWNEELAIHLWGADDDDEPWTLIYFLTDVKRVDLKASDVSKAVGWDERANWQGFTVMFPPEATQAIRKLAEQLK